MTALWIEDTVDLVGHHRVFHQVTYYESAMEGPVWECRCGERSETTLPDMAAARREGRRHTDTRILAALAGAGLLLQPGGETRHEFGWSAAGITWAYRSLDQARASITPAAVIQQRSVYTSPWAPVEGGAS